MKILKISAIVLVIVACLILLISNSSFRDREYNQIELPQDNSVQNTTLKPEYDTALLVALNSAGISGAKVYIVDLSQAAKDAFEGELKAHIRYFYGDFYLFMSSVDHREAIDVMSHEVVHVQQYLSGDLSVNQETNEVYWKGELIDLENMSYEMRPWEREAFSKQSSISEAVNSILY